jgi:hypothetical protein
VVVGTSRRLFDGNAHEIPMQLVTSQQFESGVVSLAYRPV